MREPFELIEILYKELLLEEENREESLGLCFLSTSLCCDGKITMEEHSTIKKILYNNIKTDNWFNRLFYPKERIRNTRIFYFWHTNDFESRKNYLKYLFEKY